MTLTSRDKKLLVLLAIVGIVAGYWYLVFKPRNAELGELGEKVSVTQTRLKEAEQQLALNVAAQVSYATDYKEVVRLGRAIPTNDDEVVAMASLLVQLDTLARSKAEFANLGVQKYPQPLLEPSFGTAGAGQSTAPGGSSGGEPVASGSKPGSSPNAGSSPGSGTTPNPNAGVETAGENASTSKAGAGGSAGAAGNEQQGESASLGFEPIEMRLKFEGNFFKLHRLFAAIDHLVRVGDRGIVADGRLIFVQGFNIEQAGAGFPDVAIDISAIVFALPEDQTLTGGATPEAPPQGGPEPVSQQSGSQPAGATPSATATPAKP